MFFTNIFIPVLFWMPLNVKDLLWVRGTKINLAFIMSVIDLYTFHIFLLNTKFINIFQYSCIISTKKLYSINNIWSR